MGVLTINRAYINQLDDEERQMMGAVGSVYTMSVTGIYQSSDDAGSPIRCIGCDGCDGCDGCAGYDRYSGCLAVVGVMGC